MGTHPTTQAVDSLADVLAMHGCRLAHELTVLMSKRKNFRAMERRALGANGVYKTYDPLQKAVILSIFFLVDRLCPGKLKGPEDHEAAAAFRVCADKINGASSIARLAGGAA